MRINDLILEYMELLDREPLPLELMHWLGAFAQGSGADDSEELSLAFRRRFRQAFGREATFDETERFLPVVDCGVRLRNVLHYKENVTEAV